MKSGVVAGAIGGLVGSIVALLIVALESLFVGLEPTPVPVEQIIVTFFVITIIFGAIFGAIYQKLHDPIPGTGISKGVYFGLMVYLIKDIAIAPYLAFIDMQTQLAIDYVFIGIFMWIPYGAVLGALYKK